MEGQRQGSQQKFQWCRWRRQGKRALSSWEALSLSLVLHFVLCWGILGLAHWAQLLGWGGWMRKIPSLEKTPIAIEIHEEKKDEAEREKNSSHPRQIVEQKQSPLNQEIPDKDFFLSEHNQKISHPTLARRGGGSHGGGSVRSSGGSRREMSGEKEVRHPQFQLKDILPSQTQRDTRSPSHHLVGKVSPSQSRVPPPPFSDSDTTGGERGAQSLEYIKEVDEGLETALSSKEFKYFTYFNRIRYQLHQHWTPLVHRKLIQLFSQGRSISSDSDKITRCLITLDPLGNLIRIQIIGNSGIRDLDEAAVESFRAASPFPNPPKGIIDPDGRIKIRWDFVLEV